MNHAKKYLSLALFLSLAIPMSSVALADEDGAYLDPPYRDLRHPVEMESAPNARGFFGLKNIRRSNTAAVIAKQTPVKSQGQRGTCSIFASTGLLESLLVIRGDYHNDLDLSEEWLEYVIMRDKTGEGSSSWSNAEALREHGSAPESLLPYIGETWENASSGLAAERCGHLTGRLLKSCLLGHRDPRLLDLSDEELRKEDPDLLAARDRAREFRRDHLQGMGGNVSVYSVSEVKALLAQGIPLTLDLDFYYGAWNHRRAENIGLTRNMEHWYAGIVGYPELGSVDRERSKEEPAGHAIIVVGYDDTVEVKTRVLMKDGTEKEFKYRGVYYFKNSWGSDSFGRSFELNGKSYPGYGVITQKYAHEMGGFYRLPL